ncbi:sirohydrochlorin chelatase [Bacillus sp. OK048]|uniref:sirohydrochlorin chelatase n=1 Tax=Bacillus sp. OK048 TaxID=1882761 RepID=UPI00088BD1EE|nr:sirohydrochlorin chelatase [Bacillus sp. OK048]SDM36844.1 sirohydrochlorin ferrochelatase [Bacillus sp. OK048]
MKAILYIGHGTRSRKGAVEIGAFIDRVKTRMDVPIQELCFLELTEPLIEEGFDRCVEQGATEIDVVPLFLLAAGHIKRDIPEALSPLMAKYPTIPVKIKNPFGVQEVILDAVAELIRDSAGEVFPDDRLLIVGVGSSDPDIHVHFGRIASGIGERLEVEMVSVCYFAATEPRLSEGLETIAEGAVGRVIVVPYMLFSGLLLAQLNKIVRSRQKEGQKILCTSQLSIHPVIEDIVIERAIGE